MIDLNERVLEAMRVLRESKQVLRVLAGRESELEAVRNQLDAALAEVATVRNALAAAQQTFEDVKISHQKARGKWKAEQNK